MFTFELLLDLRIQKIVPMKSNMGPYKAEWYCLNTSVGDELDCNVGNMRLHIILVKFPMHCFNTFAGEEFDYNVGNVRLRIILAEFPMLNDIRLLFGDIIFF